MRHASVTAVLAAFAFPLALAAQAPAAARFSAPVTADTGDTPGPVVAADFNADGKPDLATADIGGVSVLLGRGDGGFGTRAKLHAGSPSDLASADVNGDGAPDLVTVDGEAGGPIIVFLNDGSGRFRRDRVYRARVYALEAADLNGDGLVDLAGARLSGRHDFAVLMGTGGGRFGPVRRFTGDPEGAFDIALGDVNLDGKLDAASVTFSGRVAIRLGNGDGTFARERAFHISENLRGVTVADLNRDGKPDLVTANGDSEDVTVMLGKGDATFGPRARYAMTDGPETVVVADFDGDGNVDLAASNVYGSPAVAYGRGDGAFGEPQSILWDSALGADVADFNLDGRPDLAFGVVERFYADVFLNWTGLPAPPCVGLDVTSLTLRQASKQIVDGGCRVGTVTRRFARRVRKGRVIKQSQPSGAVLPSRTPIDLVVSRGRRP
jgi:hypothetical protein